MAGYTARVVPIAVLVGIVSCTSQLHFSRSSTNSCRDDQVCEYKYSMEAGQFRNLEKSISIEANVEVICESSGFYGPTTATRYCITVTDVGGSFLNFADSQVAEKYHMMKNYTVEYLSGVFCFVQTSDGKVVSVFHPPNEDVKVTNFKKGIVSAFQSNFKGTSQEVETDPQSRHTSHYSHSESQGETRKIHRTVTSDDVFEYSSGVDTRGVQLHEEENIEYTRDGRLVRSSGNMHLSVDKEVGHSGSQGSGGMDQFSDVVTAHGSFSMELNECKTVPRTRRRREVQRHLDRGFSLEESLMATYNEREMEIETLENLCKQLKTPEQVVAALQDTNSSKTFSMLEKVMVLERKYRPEGRTVTETVLNYLRKVKTLTTEEYVAQRVIIYSLLSSEGSRRAETALVEQLEETDLSDAERRMVMLAIALLPMPSSQVIQTIEDMIIQSNEATTSLLLVYGSLAANAPSDHEQMKIVTFLTNRIAENNTNVVIHILHALGNTKSPLAIEHIIPYVGSDNRDVRLTAVSALRFFTGLPIVQQQFVSILHAGSSDSLVEAIIHALRNGYEYNKDIKLDSELVQCLVRATNDLRNNHLSNELSHLFEIMGIPTSPLADVMESRSSRQRRDTDVWDSTASDYDIIASSYDRADDVANYPIHRGYLWSRTIGQNSGEYPIYLQAAAGLFAGANVDECELKMFGKAVISTHVLGHDVNVLTIEATNERIYIQFAGLIVFDVDPPATSYNHELPGYQRVLFSISRTFIVYGVPITLGLEATASIGTSIDISVEQNSYIEASVRINPSLTATVVGSAAVSALIAQVGVSVTASIPYGIVFVGTFRVCTPTDSDIYNSACVVANHGWGAIDITFATFYQLPDIFSFGYGERITWDPLTYIHSIPAEPSSSIYSDCVVASPATSAPPTSAVTASTEPPTTSSTEPPTTASTEPPSTASTEPPSTASTEPPSTASTEPPSTASTEPPSTASTEPPTTASTEPPSTASTEPPSIASTEPPTTASTEPPTTASTEPPSTASTEPPSTASTEPPTTASTEPPTTASPSTVPTAAAASSALGTVIPHFVFSILLLVPLLVYNIG